MASEWETYEIGEIAEIVGGGTPSTKDAANFDGGIPWLTPKDLSLPHGRYVSGGERTISDEGLRHSSARLMPAGTVLLSTRAPVGYVAIAADRLATNQGFRSLVLKDGFLPEFVYYWLLHNTEELERHASGSTFRELSGGALKRIKINIPPHSEQRAIAHILGTLDDKIELNRHMAHTLEEMARALFKAWFVDFEPVRAKMDGRWRPGESPPGLPAHLYDLFPDRLVDSELGPIPEGWEVGTIGDCAEVSNGKRPRARLSVGSGHAVPIWGGNGPMGFAPDALVDEPILLTGRVGTLGSVFRIAGPCWPSDNTLVLRPTEPTLFEYLFLCLRAIDFGSLNRGSTQPLLAQTDLKAQPLVLPETHVLERFSRFVSGLYRRVDALESEQGVLATIRDALLPNLVSRELRLDDPSRFVGAPAL